MKNILNGLAVAMAATLNLHAQERKLSLDEALAIAGEYNKGIKIEMLDGDAATEETTIAKAAMLPRISAGGGYSYYFDRQVIFMPGAFAGNDAEPVVDVAVGGKNAINAYVALEQPIVSEVARRQVKAARINESIRQLNVNEQRASLTVDVTSVYYQILLVEESIELNRQSLDRNRRSLEDSRMLLLQGKSLKIDTLRNFILVENLKTTISHLENQRKVLSWRLQQLLGTGSNETIVLTDSLHYDNEGSVLASFEKNYSDAIPNRPDIRMKQLDVELSKVLLSQQKAARLPVLSIIGMSQFQAQSDDRNFDSYRWPRTSFLGLQANVPIFTGSRVNSKIRQSGIALRRSALRLEDATEKANTEIATLQSNYDESLQRLSVQKRTVEAAEMNFRIVNDRYKNGLSTRLELSDAELALTESKMNQLNLIFSLKMAKLHLDKALGLLGGD